MSHSPKKRPPRLSIEPELPLSMSHNLSIIEGTPLIISGKEVINNVDLLQSLKVSNVINCCAPRPGHSNFTYLHLDLLDEVSYDIRPSFPSSRSFISSSPSNILIHCNAGMSRSVTVALDWLMSSKGMTLFQAFKTVKGCRPQASPNVGFMESLNDGSLNMEVYRKDRFASIEELRLPSNEDEKEMEEDDHEVKGEGKI
ncbi:hypothetical protein TrVE_jg13045 [Triparma verrucosa]|uniref:protein-tyrosine-phosphatase n=1 Tax=Triparma verrucosa TaxID=1606542 RepID=A0A9W7FAF3_9STRA|nr:hypothetical protein TrVE_jg13045 [Triparma verrucosa]